MSFKDDSPSTTNRDWIFPSQSFNVPRTPARRFSSTSFQNSLSPPSNSSPRPLRRHISHRHRIVKQDTSVSDGKSNDVPVQSEECPIYGNKTTSPSSMKLAGLFHRFSVRQQAVCIIAILVTCFISCTQKLFFTQSS